MFSSLLLLSREQMKLHSDEIQVHAGVMTRLKDELDNERNNRRKMESTNGNASTMQVLKMVEEVANRQAGLICHQRVICQGILLQSLNEYFSSPSHDNNVFIKYL
jgi:hypothetical protein